MTGERLTGSAAMVIAGAAVSSAVADGVRERDDLRNGRDIITIARFLRAYANGARA